MSEADAAARPVGGTEYSWIRAVPGGTGITVLALLLSRPVCLPLLQSALRRLQASHPLLLAQLSTASAAHPSFSLTDPSSLSLLSLNVSDLPLPPPDAESGISPFHAILERELNQNPWSDPSPDRLPLLFPTVYEMPDPARTVVALRFHTAVCDRSAAAALLKELLCIMSSAGAGGPGEGLNREIEELIPRQDAWKPFWARGKDLLGYSLNGLRTSTLRFEDAGSHVRRSEVARLVLGADATEKLLTECKERAIKLCGAISAAAMLASHASKKFENDQYETYSVVTLIDCRKYLDPVLHEHNIGFYHSAIINTHSIHSGEGLWEVAKRCHDSYSNAMNNKKHLKDIGELNFLMCRAIENPQLTPSSSLRTALISVFEEPVIHDSSKLQEEIGLDDYFGCASVHGVGPSIAVFDTIRDGKLDCACVYPSPLHSRKQIQELLEDMVRILTQGTVNDESK
ncbi:uncharacterized protein LOC121997503 isoform X1 [Zingiber officinale]|uniref:Uncharacterized protein n=1 Tax=Zingiber officinale TaxID=94328 RepID=A0A8J5GD36_ZINOF|nr:uncharacterized protein LOC121997503 isoform X1 [Zingiber officinale]KAG6500959.1 hypothetical protein ZIOFF_040821 [Zingiber officinale]